ncbi:MAG TPA: GNAT family N-acetyltransferase [Longimicrobiaceae bacterium]|nr:GNAT family N-acetyltransferase [Longimicrobiaceae bacterium]
MEFRRATDADAPFLAEINRQLIAEEWNGGGMSLEGLESRMRRWLEEGDYEALIFSEGGETVAYALVRIDEDSAYIRHFFVLREHRGRRLGSAVMKVLLGEIIPPAHRIVLDVLATNEAGQAFWRSQGFRAYSMEMERLPTPPE